MKLLSLIAAILILVSVGSATTYQQGTHRVSFNLSVPMNYTLEPPSYYSDADLWEYNSIITPDTGGNVTITIDEAGIPLFGSKLLSGASSDMIDYYTKKYELGGVKYGTTTYKGHDAFELHCPAQKTPAVNGISAIFPDVRSLIYPMDERTGITITGKDMKKDIYDEFLNSLNITKQI